MLLEKSAKLLTIKKYFKTISLLHEPDKRFYPKISQIT